MSELERILNELDLAMLDIRRAWDKLKGDLKIAENMDDYWKNLGVND